MLTETTDVQALQARITMLEAEVLKSRKLLFYWRERFLEFLQTMETRLVELDKLSRDIDAS